MSQNTRISLRTKTLAIVVATVLIGFTVTISVLAKKASSMQRTTALQYSEELSRYHAELIRTSIEQTFSTARTLAQALGGLQAAGLANRDAANIMLKNVLAAHPNALGVWTLWEPNAFDGKDSLYVNQPGHDATGRYIPYWNIGSGTIQVEPLLDYEREGAGDYYQLAKKTGEETILEPYKYNVGGKVVQMTSMVVPIKKDGVVIGVAGIDIPLSEFQSEISTIHPYNTGYASLISNNGYYIGDQDAKNVGQEIGKGSAWDSIKKAIKAGTPLTDTVYDNTLKTDVFRIYLPLQIAASKTPWSFSVSVPEKQIMAEAIDLRNMALILGLLSIIVVSVVLGFVLDRLVIKPIGGEPDDAANLAHKVAKGDLTTSIQLKPDDHSSMLQAMKAMQDKLIEIVTGIRSSSEYVANASSEIAQGNSDLSRRTEDQAASLEETAASVEELTSTVKQNADNARLANNLASNAKDTAIRGSSAVSQVVTTMQAITNESKKMFDIIGVIEGIAFQTNILALNAAVEAARAGDQGRGFAVVASEVRNLAQRCSSASKEIKTLIENSMNQVNAGSSQVENAGATMEEVMQSIQRVSTIMSEISNASDEQSMGIQQISTAITHMDEVTQQNAALVEQAMAASHSLDEQAQQLMKAVSVFHTDK
ncbi:MAG: methyl-accepting chemotaxis protein [Methylophilaceae bacterium]